MTVKPGAADQIIRALALVGASFRESGFFHGAGFIDCG